jgi:hypothetical protein
MGTAMIKRLATALLALCLGGPALAQAPPPVPALPDTDRVTTYSISGSTCACSVGFALYGDNTDYQNWLTVYVNNVQVQYNDAAFGWKITSATGPLGSIPRPVTDGLLTFNSAQTGTITIVGARRPRRVSQFSENRGVAARDLNQTVTDLVAQNRETWDLWERTLVFEPGFFPNALPLAASRAGLFLCFAPVTGQPTVCNSGATGTVAAGNGISLTGTNPTLISTNIIGGVGIAVAPSGLSSQVSMANMAASTVKCNPTAGSAAPQDCTPAQVAPLTSFVNVFTVNHTVAPSDCGGIVQMGTGSTWPLTLTLPASPLSNGFTAPCIVVIQGQASRGVKLSGFSGLGLTSPNMVWPTKSFIVEIINSAWALSADEGRWSQPSLTLNIDSSGNDANDGLATGTANAIQHLDKCRQIAQAYIDTQSGGNGGVTCLVPSGQTFQEFVQVFFPLTGGGTLIYQGSGGQFNWVPANSGYALQFGDLGVVGITNVNFTTAGSTTPAGLVLGHNYGVIDFNAGVSFNATSPVLSGSAIDCDFDTHFNINNGFNYVGTFTFLFRACANSIWNLNNAINSAATTSLGRTFNLVSGSKVIVAGNVTWGTTGLTTSVGLISGNSVFSNGAAAPPGGVVTPTTGGQYCAGGC